MPQFDTSFLSSLVFWSLVSFAILVALLYRYGFPVILEILQTRENRIREDLQRAEATRKEAEQLLSEYRSRLAQAQAEAHVILEQARKRAQELIEETERKLNRESERMIEEARQEIERERLAAMKEVRTYIVDLALETAAGVLDRQLNREDHRRLAEQVLQETGRQFSVRKG